MAHRGFHQTVIHCIVALDYRNDIPFDHKLVSLSTGAIEQTDQPLTQSKQTTKKSSSQQSESKKQATPLPPLC